MDGPEIAAYIEGRPGKILFNGNVRMTSQWKGIVLLHEAAHADADVHKKYQKNNPDSHWREEVDVFRMEHSWMAALGGEAYSGFVASEVTRFINEYDDNEGRGGKIPSLARGIQLDQAFGPAVSERETAVRRTAPGLT